MDEQALQLLKTFDNRLKRIENGISFLTTFITAQSTIASEPKAKKGKKDENLRDKEGSVSGS